MARHVFGGVLGVLALVMMLGSSPALAEKRKGPPVRVPEFDVAAAGAVATIVAGGGLLLARRRRR